MKQFLEFVLNHWILWSVFVLLILIIIFEEIRGRVQGIPRVQPHDLTQLINREDATVIDVRDHNAFAKGHILGSINIPHTQMDANIEKLKKHKDKPVVIVCGNGQTGPQEGIKLKNNGFEKIYFLSGGINAWKDAGLPLTKD
ncbi:MAG: rhodanese-like domain-containing protein [Gammaproteobacteria bacterium]|nr:rhodanese-like domain-containing protein [Gammaproteobacteria bacterium]